MSILILKPRLLTESEIGYITQLMQEGLLTAGVTTHTRLRQLREEAVRPPVRSTK